MKANEAPKKIYVHEASAPELTEKLPYHIEYTRTDAFIEKAVEYMITHIPDMHTLGVGAKIDECIIKEFRNYMKGE